MRQLAILLVLTAVGLSGCGFRVESTGPRAAWSNLGGMPTSPAGGSDDASAAMPARLIQYARHFRGNPAPLGVLGVAVLLTAVGLGVYTLRVAYRRAPEG
jgi:hypothetical protein